MSSSRWVRSERPNEAGVPTGGRGVRLSEAPSVSVVIVSCGRPADLEECLRSLLPRCQAFGVEIVVVRAATREELEPLVRAYSSVQFATAPPRSSAAELRARGVAEAAGDIVAITEDDGAISDAWLAPFVAAIRRESHR